ncbi:VOC family protein [Thermoactinospora rubra]|uniref:VOC family protein n=1 Tax=Thermoactinospora rubra TaxID=1088767 RepID=UPI000A114FA7|nr:VOC family protein [Thermoactinospora rubra]
MACRVTEIVLDCADPRALASFWSRVLDFRVVDQEEDVVELGSDSSPFTLVLVRSPDPKVVKNRLHLDVNPTDRDQEAELRRLLDLGARPVDVGQGPEVSWHVLADPEGNEFCLLRRRVT